VKDFNAQGLDCQMKTTKVEDVEGLVVGSECEIQEQVAGISAATRMALTPSAGLINVVSGLIPIFSEPELVSIIAHEMGHYYKVHTDHGHAETYNFFYTLREANAAAKPEAEAELTEIGRKALGLKIPNAS